MDVSFWKFWVDIAQAIIMFSLGVYLYLDRRNDKTNNRMNDLQVLIDAQIDDHAERLSRIESELHHIPTHQDLGQLHEKVNAVSISVSHLDGEMRQTREILQNIYNFLLTERRA